MLNQEMVVTIDVLETQGLSIKGIARETGLSKNTVKKYLRADGIASRYERKVQRPSKLEPFKDVVIY